MKSSRRPLRLPPDNRIAEIMIHARRELAEKGHENFQTASVAERCGVSEATIYRYFSTKRDLLLRVAEAWFGEILAVEPEIERKRDVLQQLRFVIRHSFEVLRKEPALSRFVLLEMRTGASYRSTQIYALNRRFTGTVITLVKRGIAEGTLRPDVAPDLVRDMVFGCIENRAWSYLRGQRDFSVEEAADSIASVVLHGLAAEPARDREEIAAALLRIDAAAASVREDLSVLRSAISGKKSNSKKPR